MKKITILIATFLIFLMSVPPLLAVPKNDIDIEIGLTGKVIYSSPEITDNKKLLERAKSGISDKSAQFHPSGEVIKDGVVIPGNLLKHYTTVQKLEEKEYTDPISHKKITKTSYRQTTFTAISKSIFTNNQQASKNQNSFKVASLNVLPINVNVALTDTINDYDGSISVYATNVIWYDYINIDQFTKAYRMIKMHSQWDRLDYQVSLGLHNQQWYQQGTGYTSSGGTATIRVKNSHKTVFSIYRKSGEYCLVAVVT